MSEHPSRRTFIQSTALTAAAFAAPAILRADKVDTQKPILGEGDFQYEATHDWGMANLPDGAHYGNASHGVTIDKNGFIYITHYGAPGSIFVFDADAKFVKSMGDFDMVSKHGGGHGIDIREENGEEFLYLAPSEPSLPYTKINLKGEVVWNKTRADINTDSGKYPGNAAYRPTNTSFSPDGGYFLGDGYGSNYIHQYDKDGKYIRTLGGTGSADGQFKTPHGHWLDDRDGTPKLVVCDRANARLQWFDMDGKHLRTQGGFLFPADIDIRGDVMLVPDLHCRVTLLDKDNKVITHLGGQGDFDAWKAQALAGFRMRGQRDKWVPGRFVHPHDACFDHNGNIIVTEWVNTGRVTFLRKLA
ncbi:MAG: peptidase [Planctomycetes bacterium]|nr:peptidase [Planctomycetota bacterium]